MSFLSNYFKLVEFTGENPVLCPFPHITPDGAEYFENRASAHVNTSNNTFNCKACGRGYGERQFIQAITGCSEIDAAKLQGVFQKLQSRYEWEMSTKLTEDSHNKALSLGISEEVIKELEIKTPTKEEDTLAFPVFVNDEIADIRIYNPGGNPKIRSMSGATNGMIIPYDIWRKTDIKRTTLICAGEKDMAIARSYGFNAITLTGGEKSTPKFLNDFKGRNVAIVYDNDQAGLEGAKKVADSIYDYAKSVKIVTGFHEICAEKGEDITDFFIKYNKTKEDLINYIKTTDTYIPAIEEVIVKDYPVVDLYTASQQYVGQIIQSNIQVVAVAETAYRSPSAIIGRKTRLADGTVNNMAEGAILTWELENTNCEKILHLIDGSLKESQIIDNIRKHILKKPNEKNLSITVSQEKTVYKMTVTDLYETSAKDVQPMEYTAYSIDCKLESGKKYLITYKLCPHPSKGGQLVMIIVDAHQANDSVNNFQLNEKTIQNLKLFQSIGKNIPERIDTLVEMNKEFIGYNGINQLIKTIDLSFHTPLRFNFGRIKDIRGYLDTLIVGESRTGKSSTADALRKLYGLGTFTSLAGNSATIAGLVGGSSKGPTGTMQTRAGVIPQNHMGLIIFEEFGKSNKDVLKELTDIRSSNEVRIARVTGTTTLPALVRMIALTNVKTKGEIKSIASYPNGVAIVTELVNTAEDIARYDNILILSETGQQDIDPLWEPMKALPVDAYKDKIRWIWTRKSENIIISKELEHYIIDLSNHLNQEYPSHIKLFGTETWKKLTRIAIAVAGYTVSASEDFKNIIVTKECIDYAANYMISLYDNSTFKFREYVEMEQRYRMTDDEAVDALQTIYNKFPSLVLQLEQQNEITKSMLESTTGLESLEIRKGLQLLTRSYFIKVDSTSINPTERFRLTMNKINKGSYIGKVGEL
ncbi:MAG: ATP-binding protein [Clostridium sp.]|nr:ATP-binding protein [Clostridium sp.]